jgi:exonuclease SbcC
MELKSKILDLFNYPGEFSKKQNLLYKFTVYTPQEEMKQIILQDSETRINTLRHVFGIDKYKKILENTSIIASKIREERRINENILHSFEQDKSDLISREIDIETKSHNLISIEKELFLKSDKSKKIHEEMEILSKKLEEERIIKQEIEKQKIFLSNKKENFSNNLKSVEQLKAQINETGNLVFDEYEISRLNEQLKLKKNEKDFLTEENIKISSKINSLTEKIKDSESLTEKIKHLENCPTCLQTVDQTYKNNILEKTDLEIKDNLEGIEFMENERKIIIEKISAVNSEISSVESKIQDLNILRIRIQGLNEKKLRVAELEKSNLNFEKEIFLLSREINEKESSLSQFDELNGLFEKKRIEFDEATRQEKIAEIKVAELRKEIEVFSKHLEILKEKIRNMENIEKKIKYLTELDNWLSKKFVPMISFVEKNVMLKLKSEFSKLFSEWFSMLVSDTFNVRLNDDFTPIIEHQDYEIDYAYLSGGERTAIALAYRLSLNQIINSLMSNLKTKDIVILDEPTDGFSDQQLDKMRDVLYQLNVKQLIIVSHEQKMEGFVDNVIKFRKVDGISVKE